MLYSFAFSNKFGLMVIVVLIFLITIKYILNNDKYQYTDINKIKKLSSENGAKDVKEDKLHDDRYSDLSLDNLVKIYGIPAP